MTDLEKEVLEEESKADEALKEAKQENETEGGDTGEEMNDDSKPEETEEAGDALDSDTDDAIEEDKKKNLFRKKEKKDKKDKAAEQIAELTDKVKRQMAEFDNFRKRSEREKSQMYEVGAKSVIEKILPVLDNFERGLSAVPEESKEDPFVQGMDKIYKQLMTELENLGVKPIQAVGEEFNPDFHNAVMQVENDELESGTVAQELLKGYMYRESVVRHSMVSVVQ